MSNPWTHRISVWRRQETRLSGGGTRSPGKEDALFAGSDTLVDVLRYPNDAKNGVVDHV